MRILVTGSLGVVGSKLVEILDRRGHKVFGVDLFHTNKRYGHGLGKVSDDNYFRCDISEYRQLESVVNHVKPDIVYNCAAEFGRWNGEHFYEKVWKSNAIGVKNILRLQERDRFQLVQCSTSEVYGDYNDVMYEDVINDVPIHQMNDYAISKKANEMQIKNSITQYGTETVIVRLFNTYGPGEWYHPFRSVNCLFTYNLLHGLPITLFTGHTRTSTYIYDCVTTLANIAKCFIPGSIYNIASKEQHTIEKLAEIILEETGASRDLVNIVENHEILTTKSKLVSSEKALVDLRHKDSYTLEQGVAKTVSWMREYYSL